MTLENEKQSDPVTSKPTLSPTPTLAPVPGAADGVSTDQDHEKQDPGPPEVPFSPFPEGGLRAWSAVIGAWLAGKHCLYTMRGQD